MTSRHTLEDRLPLWPIVLCAFVLLPLCFAGYGSDNDTYSMLDSGRLTWVSHIPDTSRNPGYWTFEAIVFCLSRSRGYLATNFATLTIGLICLWRFLIFARRSGARYPALATFALAATPVFAIACTSTNDYVWSLLGIILFAEFLVHDKLALAILPAAFAFAVRGANGSLVAGAIVAAVVVELVHHRRPTARMFKLIFTGMAAAILGSPPYIVSWLTSNHSFAFLEPSVGPESMWSLKMWIGRFIYKTLYLFGPAALLVAAWAFFRRKPALLSTSQRDDRKCATPVFVGIVAANLLLFLRYPIEISYLIPAAFFLLLLAATFLLTTRAASLALLAAILALNFVTPQIAKPDKPGQSTQARLHLALAPGFLVEDLRLRLRLRGCSTYDCYHSVIGK